MALTFDLVFTVEDEKGKQSDTTVNVPTTFSLTAYTEFAQACANVIDDLIGGILVACILQVLADISGLTGNVRVQASDVEEKGHFKFRTVAGRSVDVKIPGFDESLMTAGTDDIDTTTVAVNAFVNMMEDGLSVTGGTIIPCDVDEDDILGLEFARESYVPRNSRS